jgi:hypothetical protein
MRVRSLLAVCVLMLASACVTTSEFERSYPPAKPVSGSVAIGDKMIPLPPGEWVVAATESAFSGAATPLAALSLVNVAPGAHAVLVTAHANLGTASGAAGWTSLRSCARDDMLFIATEANEPGGDQRCWFINHSGTTRASRTSRLLKDTLDFAQARGLRIPSTVLTVGYRLADIRDVLTVRYYFDPETRGFPPSRELNWRSNDWHRDRMHGDERRQQYIAALKSWGAETLPGVRGGFRGKAAMATEVPRP